MKLAASELALVHSHGLFILEKCGDCGKLLNQSFRYTAANRSEVFCSAACQDKGMGWNRVRSQKAGTEKATPPAFVTPVCQRCQRRFRAKRRDAQFCSARCRQWERRKRLREGEGVTTNAVVTDDDFSPSPEAHK
jgi:endogenous inhibitor of DNA gyrase (YacG/DUF329 family)